LIGISERQYLAYETGELPVTLKLADSIDNKFNIPMAYILHGTGVGKVIEERKFRMEFP